MATVMELIGKATIDKKFFIQNLTYEEFMGLDRDRMNEYLLTEEELHENREFLKTMEGQMELQHIPDEEADSKGSTMLSGLIRAAKESRAKEEELIANETLEERLKRMPFHSQLCKLFHQAVAMKIPEEEIMKYVEADVSIIKVAQFVNSYKAFEKKAAV